MPDHRKVAVFWDYENCSPPLISQGHAIVNGIRRIAHVFGHVTTFKTYFDMSSQHQSPRSINFRSELQSSGVSMVDCPHNGRKDVVDKMILVDMLAFAIDHDSPATVVLIAGDRDYAYAMSTLRHRQYTVVLIVPSGQNVSQSLQSQASVVIDWNYAILGKRPEADMPPVRQPYRDLDEDIVERLTREIRDLNEDSAATLLSSSHPTAAAPTYTRYGGAAEPLQPSPFQRNAEFSDATRPAPMCTPKKAASIFPGTLGHGRVGSAASRARSTTQSAQVTPDIDRDPVSPVADEIVSTVNEIQDASYVPFARPPIMSSRLERFQNIAEPGSPSIGNLRNFSPSPSPSATFSLGSRTTPFHSHSPLHSRTISGGTPISYGNPPQKTVPPAMPSSFVSTGGRGDATNARKSTNSGFVSVVMNDSILPSDRVAVLDALGFSDDEDKGDYSNGEIANDSSNSPRLIEVDDPPHIYVMNDVESSPNDGQASFHDISRSPPTTDTSLPRTQPSVIQTSQQSILAPSFSEPNVTIPKMGPPQATSVISDNSDHHSSGCQAHPIESVEDRIRHLTPPQFLPLINQLLLEMSKGNMRPTRRSIAKALKQYDEDIYKRAGVTNVKFGDYASQAQRASLIEFGGQESLGEPAWIALHPNLFKDETTTESADTSLPRTRPSGTPMSQQSSLSASFSDPNITMPNVGIGSPQATSVISDNSDNRSSWYYKPPFESAEDSIRRLTPLQFLPLINQLLLVRSKGTMKPTRSEIYIALFQNGADICKRASVTRFWEYILQAEQASLVVLGGHESQGEQSWIALHPNLFKEETTTEPVEEIAVEFVNETAIESVEDKIRRLTPPQFLPMIEQLLLARSKGIMKPGMFTIAFTLLQYDKDAYKRMGVNKFRDYALLAEQAFLIELGGREGDAWIALHPNWFKEETNAPPSTPSTVHSNDYPASQDNIEALVSTSSTPPPALPWTTTSHPNTPRMPYKPIPLCFVPLITCLLNVQQGGIVKPLRSTVGMMLESAVCFTAGVASMKEYFDLAVDDEIVEIGEDDGYAWVRLHPNALSGKHFY
ncbi:hypothetical protein K503DRAFT_735880 [Rhizopogon vinicolor AM-OR11-026]|uniref:NYN domain-containing protein n=1 Tax=Rhizopogon vinicolor AM-OR11-026 TaxID=1314800 RepID=A0A1B7N8Z8_9AGAM|nr:hypothetical protein K503DRAFT_735880 [Rhizopogon vinicolor AM-OR11-026]